MAMPTSEQLMLPLLQLTADGEEHSIREAVDALANQFGLSSGERSELLPSGKQARFANRIGWASTALRKAILLKPTRSSHFRITGRGRELLAQKPGSITDKLLRQYSEYTEYVGSSQRKSAGAQSQSEQMDTTASNASPLERLTEAYSQLTQEVADQLLARVKSSSPEFFERLVVELLHKMGYGGSFRDAAQAIGRSGDGGVDGVIKEDRLGLDMIYVQAKRYTVNNVPAGDLRNFVGALAEKNARKGVFITTSAFAAGAIEVPRKIEGKTLVLVDGDQLVRLMTDYSVGTVNVETFQIPRIDDDYFEGEPIA